MSVRNGFVLFPALSALMFLAACGSSNGVSNPVAPPSGQFSNSNLNGSYVFSVSGTDSNGAAYALAGTITTNGSGGNNKGGITGGTLDINDIDTQVFTGGPIAEATINNNGTYSVSVDGRGQFTFGTNISGFPNLTFDFVLTTTGHGLLTEFDSFGTGSGTIDAQTASVTPSGVYSFNFSGASYSGSAFASAGDFTVNSSAITGVADFNNGGIQPITAQPLSGTIAVSSSSGPATTITTSGVPTLTFDVFPIDGQHLKFIEMDENYTLSGDAFAQTATTIGGGTSAFTLDGLLTGDVSFAAGGFIVTDGAGNITNSSSEDFNANGNVVPSAV